MIRLDCAAALALILASPALAQDKPDPAQAARDAKLREVVLAVSGKQPQQAVSLVDPLLAEYESLYGGAKTPVYCDTEDAETAAYKTLPGGAGARVVDGGWCIALWAKGFAMIDLEQLDGAVPYLERSVALSPLHPHYLSELGYAYQAQKKWQASYDLYARAAEAAKREVGEQQKKSFRRAWFGMGFDLIELGRLDEAEALMKKCLELNPDDPKVKGEFDYISEQRAKQKKS
ncbi:MAG: tetratricopeptide repeat protein [Sphingomonas sp.]|uniref:tetratricopeptide repeat protein n=1 Tax=Sphingomonas sp. TaxID=28214 RepID=UPI001B20C1F5|nr:tetratricopeptide repeat protein [Sphingomonas sp.]MBO9623255.1 tetratricopeptide repeat protein [Sphingomonas sp.]